MQDRPGVLNRVVSLFRRRGFNIESLAVGHTETPGVSRMTLVVEAADVEQVIKQLYRLIEVLKVSDVTDDPTVEREMALVKIHAPGAEPRRDRGADAASSTPRSSMWATTRMIIEMTGTPVQGRELHRGHAAVRRQGDDAHRADRDGARRAHPPGAGRSAESGNGHVPAQAAALN